MAAAGHFLIGDPVFPGDLASLNNGRNGQLRIL